MKTIKDQDHFEVLRKIDKNPKTSQRKMAVDLGFSLGKLNYCLKALQKKGLIKFNNFRKSKNKIKYLYFITPQGMTLRIVNQKFQGNQMKLN